jgi:kinesin family protein 15
MTVSYACTCSYVEIYNERIYDLLDTKHGGSTTAKSLREDITHGVFIQDVVEYPVQSSEDALAVLETGQDIMDIS